MFSRAKAVIGRRVQHCQPPSSVHVVERILGDFRSGRQDVAEFWIDLRGRFVHIRYFAVRDEAGDDGMKAAAVADRPRVAITPATRIAELLESWPELEDVLVAQAPAFRRRATCAPSAK